MGDVRKRRALTMTYELWDVSINRLLGEFAQEVEALQEALVLIDHFGEGHAANLLVIGDETEDGVTGIALVARARALASVPAD
jgi:hypothetical protein